MSHIDTHIIAISTIGDDEDITVEEIRAMARTLIEEMRTASNGGRSRCQPVPPSIDNIDACISPSLEGPRGGYVVIAGDFNYWLWDDARIFSQRLSQRLDTEVLHAHWCEGGEREMVYWFHGKDFDLP